MVGEIRDRETAEISVRAALMGSLFFSTMHTINSVGAIVRFLEFKLPRSLIASSLLAIIAQRLIRTICPHCKTKSKPDRELIELAGISKEYEARLFKGRGCGVCGNSGYLGRTGIFEVMFIDKEIQRLILEGAPYTEIEREAKKSGMKTLREIAIEKALEGMTTLEEAFRVTP
jgi:type II secretory ATPase GspE/PulE/Tfp pilus assembly ATPase PilB-like protein